MLYRSFCICIFKGHGALVLFLDGTILMAMKALRHMMNVSHLWTVA